MPFGAGFAARCAVPANFTVNEVFDGHLVLSARVFVPGSYSSHALINSSSASLINSTLGAHGQESTNAYQLVFDVQVVKE